MLFQKKIAPRCIYCARGAKLNAHSVMCIKRGVVAAEDHCKSFRYDPLKRVPPRPMPPDFSKLTDEDFAL